MIQTLICIDRDGTLILDEKDHLYLGRDEEWKSKVVLLPGVIQGIKALNAVPDSALYMITNQPGVAISDFPLLSQERAHEVCRFVMDKIINMGGHLDGYLLCPHANRTYVEQHPAYHFDSKLVCECNCIKPDFGMVSDALKAEGVVREDVNIYVIGDRATDVETALNIGGTGILVPFKNEPGEDEKARKLADPSRVFIAGNLTDAAEFIVQQGPSTHRKD